jgi:hypothetical protein
MSVAYLTRPFLHWLYDDAARRGYPLPWPLPHGLRPAQRWAVRSLGLMHVWPVVFSAGTMMAHAPPLVSAP